MRPWLFLALVACGSDQPTAQNQTGISAPVDLFIGNDAPLAIGQLPKQALAVYVTIDRIDAKSEKGPWITLDDSTLPKTIDLMLLKDDLGVVRFPIGKHVQLRLYTSKTEPGYVVTSDHVHHPLMVPSGSQSGIKVFGDFNVDPCAMGKVSIFTESIQVEPMGMMSEATWMLRPVIRIREVVLQKGDCVTLE